MNTVPPGRSVAAALSVILLMAVPAYAAPQRPAVHVTVETLDTLRLYPAFSAPATSISINESQISAEIAARIIDIPVRVGDSIGRSQVLIRLDCREQEYRHRQAQAVVDSAQARVRFADRQLQRVRKLSSQRNVSEETLNQREMELLIARADLSSARAGLDELALNVSRCEILAPFDAVVLQRLVSIGELVSPGTGVVRILDRSDLEVSARVPLTLVDSLEGARELWFEVRDLHYPLALRIVTPAIDTLSRTREARLTFTARRVLPGTAGRLRWRSPAPHLPASLIVRRGDRLGVFISEDGRARFVPLPGALEGRPAPVAGLAPDAGIVVDGRQALRDGDALIVLE